MDSVNILITGAGAPGAAGIIHCLRQDPSLHIIGADANADASGKILTDEFVVIPRADNPEFLPTLKRIALDRNVQVIMPLVTRELLLFASVQEEWKQLGIQVMVSSLRSLEIANDKGALYSFLQQSGIPVPQFIRVENLAEMEMALHRLGFPESTVCFKPCKANGSRGFRILHPNPDELHLLFQEKPSHTYIRWNDARRILSSGEWPPLLVCEYLPGEEFSVDCLVIPGQEPLIVPRRRDRIVQGISTAGTFLNDSEIIDYCKAILIACELTGNIGIQVKRNHAGAPRILEINPRVQGTISAGLGAGVNLPLLAVGHALGKKVDLSAITPIWGTRFVRVWQELFYAD